MNKNELFLAKTRQQNRSLAELNEDFDGEVFAKKNHFEQNKINSNSFFLYFIKFANLIYFDLIMID